MPLQSLAAAWRRAIPNAPDCAQQRDDGLQVARESHGTAARFFALFAAGLNFLCTPPRIFQHP